jgi:abortive infection bacteriophage resistance protein
VQAKPFKTLDEQIEILRGRGLVILDEDKLRSTINWLNYYRASGYFRQFQDNPSAGRDNFVDGATDEDVLRMVRLDSELRLLLFEGISIVEVAVRSRLAHALAKHFGEKAFYLDEKHYKALSDVPLLVDKIREAIFRAKSLTVARYVTAEGDFSEVPIWVAVELISLGSLVKLILYTSCDAAVDELADDLSIQRNSFKSIMSSLQHVRNRAAHHAQLWHRPLQVHCPIVPIKLKRDWPAGTSPQGLYPAIAQIKKIVRIVEPTSNWPSRIDTLLSVDGIFQRGVAAPFAR